MMHSIKLQPGSIWIDGEPVVLLVSSLFYFRIPSAEWRSRMRTLRLLGYNAIDVYFPWNYHEVKPGQWDFGGERDVRAFLQQAKEEGLWVVARPGPYICSEWNGGALPAYLNAEIDLRLRDNSVPYLQAVRRWYEQIMPLLAEYQLDRAGTIICVQIENELDFYDSSERTEMMAALRDMALAHGITVPLVACSGQGNIITGTGEGDGIVPTCNIYFDPGEPNIEERVRHYYSLLRQLGYPLCVVETNRSHMDLRRLIAGGAKLVGPYLQTGGMNFGFTNGVTNWGDPLAFITTHYDFGGMISPAGRVRQQGREAILLSRMIAALGPALALSVPDIHPPVAVQGVQGQSLSLDGGGWLIGLPNTGQEIIRVRLGEETTRFPVKTELKVLPGTCPFILLNYPLSRWGIDGTIMYATAELVGCETSENVLALTFAVDSAAEVLVNWSDSALNACQGWEYEKVDRGWRIWLNAPREARAEIINEHGKRLLLKGANRTEIGDLKLAGLDEGKIVSASSESQKIKLGESVWYLSRVDPCGTEWFGDAQSCQDNILYLEKNNIFRGFGWYRSSYVCDDVAGFLIQSGSDVLSLYLNSRFIATLVPGGGSAYVSLPKDIYISPDKNELVIRSEIWGHSCFEDDRLPALSLKSMRGVGSVAAVQRVENISFDWWYQHKAQYPMAQVDLYWPRINFGGWFTTEEPAEGVYYKELPFEDGMDVRVLHFPDLQVVARVFINGQFVATVNPFAPFVDLSALSSPGETAMIAVATEQYFHRPAGRVLLYQGKALRGWEVAGWDEDKLAKWIKELNTSAKKIKFPMELVGGEMVLLRSTLPSPVDWEDGWALQVIGRGLKASVWLDERLIGRLWLPSEARPRMAGGRDDRLFLPAGWLRQAAGLINLLLESVDPVGKLEEVNLILDS